MCVFVVVIVVCLFVLLLLFFCLFFVAFVLLDFIFLGRLYWPGGGGRGRGEQPVVHKKVRKTVP